jgi:glycine/D-amino acid oxidase-like deaminating enzyme
MNVKKKTRPRFRAAAIAGMALAIALPAGAADSREADVVVYSGVPGGIAAAIHAAREGAKVLLVEPTRHVGGLSTSGINTAETEHMVRWTIGGFALEFYRRMGRHYEETKAQQTHPHKNPRLDTIYFFESSVALKVYLDMLQEAGVEVMYGARVDTVTKDGARITGITLTDGTKLSAKVFVDASYEGDLMARAGVSYAVGREARSEFDEDAAGVRFDPTRHKARTVDEEGNLLPGISAWAKDLTVGAAHPAPMNYNFRLTVARDPALQVPFPAPKKYDAKRYALLANWLRSQTSRGNRVQRSDLIDSMSAATASSR